MTLGSAPLPRSPCPHFGCPCCLCIPLACLSFPRGTHDGGPGHPLASLGSCRDPATLAGSRGHGFPCGGSRGTDLPPPGQPALSPVVGSPRDVGTHMGWGDAGQGKPWTTSCSDGTDEDQVSLQHPCGTAHLAPSRAWPGGVKVTQWDRGGVQEPFTAPHARQRPPSPLLPGLPPRLPLTSPRRSQQLFWELQSHWRN